MAEQLRNTTFAQWLSDKVIRELQTSGIQIAETLKIFGNNDTVLNLIDSPQIEHIQTFTKREYGTYTKPPTSPGNSPGSNYDPPEYAPWDDSYNEIDPEAEEPWAPPIVDSDGVVYEYHDEIYYPYPFRREGIKREVSNINKQTRISLPDTQDGLFNTMLKENFEFRGKQVILSQVFMNHKHTPANSIILINGHIQDWQFDSRTNLLTFSVTRLLLGNSAPWPRRHMLASCTHVFRGTRCGVTGFPNQICKKTRKDCEEFRNLPHFGGFPWVAARQRRIMWR
jgi:phage-related protein